MYTSRTNHSKIYLFVFLLEMEKVRITISLIENNILAFALLTQKMRNSRELTKNMTTKERVKFMLTKNVVALSPNPLGSGSNVAQPLNPPLDILKITNG
jgi:hypothetical protein